MPPTPGRADKCPRTTTIEQCQVGVSIVVAIRTAIYRGPAVLWARNPRKVSKRSTRASQPGVSKKCRKKSQKTRKRVKVVSKSVFKDFSRGNLNRCTKRPLQDSAIISSTPGMGKSVFCCAHHRVSCKCQQPPEWKIHRFFRWKMPFAVFRSGSGVSDFRDSFDTPGGEPRGDLLGTFGVFRGGGAWRLLYMGIAIVTLLMI